MDLFLAIFGFTLAAAIVFASFAVVVVSMARRIIAGQPEPDDDWGSRIILPQNADSARFRCLIRETLSDLRDSLDAFEQVRPPPTYYSADPLRMFTDVLERAIRKPDPSTIGYLDSAISHLLESWERRYSSERG